jgi:hypothetical protein
VFVYGEILTVALLVGSELGEVSNEPYLKGCGESELKTRLQHILKEQRLHGGGGKMLTFATISPGPRQIIWK